MARYRRGNYAGTPLCAADSNAAVAIAPFEKVLTRAESSTRAVPSARAQGESALKESLLESLESRASDCHLRSGYLHRGGGIPLLALLASTGTHRLAGFACKFSMLEIWRFA